MFGFDPIGAFLGWLFILLVLGAAAVGLITGGVNLLVAWRHHPRAA